MPAVSPPPPSTGRAERSGKGKRGGFRRPCCAPLPKIKHVGTGGVRGRQPGQPPQALLSHAEQPATARTLRDPAAAPGSGGQTWQRPGSATTTCGRPPPGRAAPPPHAPGNPPAPGSLACKPAGVQPEPLTSRHVISTGCPAGEGGFGTDEMEAGTPGRSPRRAAGDERPRPYLDGKAE